ncbi:hypothetical protein [uncultured Desulfuromonas sp.]|uniref:hypothetical protein n=1 Tax=uncultured Desulfuromonas sp. TaxID=181013 RepID=UPI002AABCD2D|nr:hypothetical protein [uncultured Desulfuromonas sp.]
MDAGVFEIFGTRYYTHGFGLLLVAPFAFWFIVSVIGVPIRLLERKPLQWYGVVVSAFCTFVMLIVVFWDVYQIGQQATKLCNEEAGLHVYRTAEAESFLGAAGIRGWAEYGFEFTEGESDKDKIRYFMENGKPTYKKVDQFLSQYELVTTRKKITNRIGIIKQQIKDRNSNEVLGEANEFKIHGGWADMLFFNLTGFSYSPWICSGRNQKKKIYPSDLVKAVLAPINKL